jgi:primosomal protein N' (replication factor Y)
MAEHLRAAGSLHQRTRCNPLSPAVLRYATITPIPPIAALDALTYRVPEDMLDRVAPGSRVLVPLGRRRVTGLVTAVSDDAPADLTCRDVGAVLDHEPIVGEGLLRLLVWMADYYGASFAEAVSLAVGRGLTTASTRVARLIDAGAANNASERRLVEALAAAGGALEMAALRRTLAGPAEAALRALAARGAVLLEEHVAEPKTRALKETWIEVATEPDEATRESLFARAPKRREIYELVRSQPARKMAARKLAEMIGSPSSQVAALVEAGVLRKSDHEVYRDLDVSVDSVRHEALSVEQERAVIAVTDMLGTFTPVLLQGVTASGKTEVYLRVIAEALARDTDALVLVPEISLTHQVVARLIGRFGPTVAVLHSELSAGERWDQWRRIRRRDARIVVGARSAVLAPIEKLGIVVVDEEHDPAYKQEEGVRYHGRDVAIVRARQASCPVVLGSATPSIETWRAAHESRYVHLVLKDRVTGGPLPRVEVVDLRGRDIEATGGLSEYLADCMRRNLEEKGQTLLFLNRRGYAASMQCYQCGEILACENCSVGMTLHRSERRLRCHHCDCSRGVPPRCPDCGADALVAQGLGTQRLESTVHTLFPNARLARLDRDIAARKGRQREILEAWFAGELDILIGTQMISKGHDAAGVTLVGVVHADLSLGIPDFRAAERTFQLLSQVAGRAGRGSRPGRVIVQTYRPDHFAIAAAVRHDYEAFATRELEARAELGYPPLTRMALLRIEGEDEKAVDSAATAAARALARLADRTEGLVVRGPAPAPIEKRKGRYRYQIQLRAADGRLVRHAAVECRRLLAERFRKAGIRLMSDIDPVDMS